MLYQWIGEGSRQIRKDYDASASRTLYITGAAGIFCLLMGVGKIISGVLSLSVFVCVNGGYTLGMAAARYCALAGVVRTKEGENQYAYYRFSGIIMTAASLLYVVYSLWMIRHPKTVDYGSIIAITIATITFTEIGVNIWGILKYRKNRTPLLHALKIISLGTSLISLVLTQSAILAFADNTHDPGVNGYLGIITGGCAALLGVYMIRHMKDMEKSTYDKSDYGKNCFYAGKGDKGYGSHTGGRR